ncbi:MAG: ankyrin repeat domain-containing protein [Isosphaeraceae bacterium]
MNASSCLASRRAGWFVGFVLLLAVCHPAAARAAQPPSKELNSSDWTPLMLAAKAGDFPRLVIAIQDGAKVNERSARDGMTAVMVAAWYEQLDCVSALLFNKADPNLKSRTGMTALMIAAGRGNAPITRELLDWKADPNAVSEFGATPLTFGATTGSLPVVEALIEAKARLDYQDPNGATPLMLAAAKGHVDVVKALLAAGADRALKDKSGFDVEAVARATGHPEVLPILADAPEIKKPNKANASEDRAPGRKRSPTRATPSLQPPPFVSEPSRALVEDLEADRGEPPPGWTVVRLEPTAVTLALPADPERDDTPTDSPLGRADCHDLNVDHDGLDYYFSHAAYPESAKTIDDESFFAQMARYALFDGVHRQVAPARRYRYGSLPARSVQYDSIDTKGKTFTTWLRLVRDGRVAYIMAVNARRGALDFERARDFFRAVRLPPPGTAPPAPSVPRDASTWVVYKSRSHGFRVEFPVKPQGEDVDAGRLLDSEIVEADQGSTHFRVFVSKDPSAEEAQRDFDQAVANTRSLGKDVVSERSLRLGRWTASEFVTRDEDVTPPRIKRVRFLHDGRAYYVSLTTTSPEPDDDPTRAQRFLDSFRAEGLVPSPSK